jgi:hypothetical protein
MNEWQVITISFISGAVISACVSYAIYATKLDNMWMKWIEDQARDEAVEELTAQNIEKMYHGLTQGDRR